MPPAVAVIVAVPAFNAVTLPFTTFATELSELCQVTVLSVALLGETVAVSVYSSPTSSESEIQGIVTPITSTVAGGVSGLRLPHTQTPSAP